jgi:general stress protein 26
MNVAAVISVMTEITANLRNPDLGDGAEGSVEILCARVPFAIHWRCGMTRTVAMQAGSASVERLLAAAAATMEKAPYCWAMTVAEDGSVNARPMGALKLPTNEDPFGVLFITRRGSRKAREIGSTDRLSVVYQHDADDSYLILIGRGLIITDRAVLRALWQPALNQFFPGGADDETAICLQLEANHIELWVRGVTPEPFGTRGVIIERDQGQPWRLVQG